MSKQTAVEWLVQQLTEVDYKCVNKTFLQLNKTMSGIRLKGLVEQAKQMEREQHLESYRVGNAFTNSASLDFKDFFDEYYNKTYRGDK